MPKTSDIDLGGRLTVLSKGEPGSGKTVASCSFPGPIYVFDTDGRMKPVKLWYPERTDIDYDTYTVDDYPKFESKVNQLQVANKYKTVVIASLTTFADMILRYSMSLRGRKGNEKGIIKLLEIEDFGTENQGMAQIIDELRKMRCHVIVEAHLLTTVHTDIVSKEETVIKSIVTGGKKIAAKLPAYFDEVWHFYWETTAEEGKGVKRYIHTQPGSHGFAKTALPLNPKIEFTNKKLFDVIEAELAFKGVKLAR